MVPIMIVSEFPLAESPVSFVMAHEAHAPIRAFPHEALAILRETSQAHVVLLDFTSISDTSPVLAGLVSEPAFANQHTFIIAQHTDRPLSPMLLALLQKYSIQIFRLPEESESMDQAVKLSVARLTSLSSGESSTI